MVNKKLLILTVSVLSLILISAIATNAQNKDSNSINVAAPNNGHYQGKTSQNQDISFDVISGKVKNINWDISPTCNGEIWGFGGWSADWYGSVFQWNYNVNDKPGEFDSLVPLNYIFVLGSGRFDTSTHARGSIKHGLAYYTGNKSSIYTISQCQNFGITYEVNWVSSSTSKTEQIKTIQNEDMEIRIKN